MQKKFFYGRSCLIEFLVAVLLLSNYFHWANGNIHSNNAMMETSLEDKHAFTLL